MEKHNTGSEIWKDIIGYEGYYEVSNMGRIRSVTRTVSRGEGRSQMIRGKMRAVQTRKDGYQNVNLYKDGKQKGFYVHRLVAQAFVPNPENQPIINHIDEDPSNNNLENLEWCTHQYNLTYGGKIQRTLDSKGYKERTERIKRPIYVKTPYDELMWYESITLACEVLELEHSSVVACLKGINKTHRNLRFEYAKSINR